MKRITIAAGIAAATCMISIPAVAALASSNGSSSNSGPSHSQLVDDRSGPNRGSDDITQAATPTSIPTSAEPGDDNGTHAEPGDDRGSDCDLE